MDLAIVDEPISTLFIGLVAQDTICSIHGSISDGDSNPARIESSIGGVGFNIALAHHYSVRSKSLPVRSRLLTAVGKDTVGQSIIDHISDTQMDVDGIKVVDKAKTAQYVATLKQDGSLALAAADMLIMESTEFIDHFKLEIQKIKPKIVVVDCNLSFLGLNSVLQAVSSLEEVPRLIVEPTSAPKLRCLAKVDPSNIKVFPQNTISLITPTANELSNIHDSFNEMGFFDDFDSWFPLLDLIGMNSLFLNQMESLARKNAVMRKLLEQGIVQQAMKILPYIPNILVKLGSDGCVFFSLNTNINDYNSVPTTSAFKPSFTLISHGKDHGMNKTLGVTMEHFAVPPENRNISIVNETGAGDTLLGYLTSSLSQNDWLTNEIVLLEQEWGKWEGIYKSQVASGKTLQSSESVSKEILKME